jgi:hypothetical protein
MEWARQTVRSYLESALDRQHQALVAASAARQAAEALAVVSESGLDFVDFQDS